MLIRLIALPLLALCMNSCGEEPVHVLEDPNLQTELNAQKKENLSLQKQNKSLKNWQEISETSEKAYESLLGKWENPDFNFCVFYNTSKNLYEYKFKSVDEIYSSLGMINFLWQEKFNSDSYFFMRLIKQQVSHIVEFRVKDSNKLFFSKPQAADFYNPNVGSRRNVEVHLNTSSSGDNLLQFKRKEIKNALTNTIMTSEQMKNAGEALCSK